MRYKSDFEEEGTPVYERNPYVTTDLLVKRLTGCDKTWNWIGLDQVVDLEDICIVAKTDKSFLIGSRNKTILIPQNSFYEVLSDGNRRCFGDRIILYPNKSQEIQIKMENSDSCFIFGFDNQFYVFGYLSRCIG